MRIREAVGDDVPHIVQLLMDDDLGRQRGSDATPLDDRYWRAFDAIDGDPNHQLVVLEREDAPVAGCLQPSFLPYLTFRGGWRAQIEAVRVASALRGAVGNQVATPAIGEPTRVMYGDGCDSRR